MRASVQKDLCGKSLYAVWETDKGILGTWRVRKMEIDMELYLGVEDVKGGVVSGKITDVSSQSKTSKKNKAYKQTRLHFDCDGVPYIFDTFNDGLREIVRHIKSVDTEEWKGKIIRFSVEPETGKDGVVRDKVVLHI